MALTITPGYTVSSGEVWTPTKHNLSTVPSIQIAQGEILARATVGTGAVEALTVAQLRTLLGLGTADSPIFAGLSINGAITILANNSYLRGTLTDASTVSFIGIGADDNLHLQYRVGKNIQMGDTGAIYAVLSSTGLAVTGTTSSTGKAIIGTAGTNDYAQIQGNAAGSGIGFSSLNSGATDYAAINITGYPINFSPRTTAGSSSLVGTIASTGLTITGTITSSGNMNAPVFNVTSARRFKKNIRRLVGTDALLKLRPVWYDDKRASGGKRLVGFIAEEVKKVLPSMVGHDDKGRVSGVNYSQLVALAVAGLQDHEARLRKLERKAA